MTVCKIRAGSLLAIFRHGQLFVPWDDDFDVAVRRSSASRLVAALDASLRQSDGHVGDGMYVEYVGNSTVFDDPCMYKLFFSPQHREWGDVVIPHARHDHAQQREVRFAWPFVDVFVSSVPHQAGDPLGLNLLEADEELAPVTVEGVRLEVPVTGPRCRGAFEARGLMAEYVAGTWNHKHQAHMHRALVAPREQ